MLYSHYILQNCITNRNLSDSNVYAIHTVYSKVCSPEKEEVRYESKKEQMIFKVEMNIHAKTSSHMHVLYNFTHHRTVKYDNQHI